MPTGLNNLTQLKFLEILTLPLAFLGTFDFKKIAFVDYVNIQDAFYINDFNWNVTSSNHESKEFQLIKERIENADFNQRTN